jgi:hypothetical protein
MRPGRIAAWQTPKGDIVRLPFRLEGPIHRQSFIYAQLQHVLQAEQGTAGRNTIYMYVIVPISVAARVATPI